MSNVVRNPKVGDAAFVLPRLDPEAARRAAGFPLWSDDDLDRAQREGEQRGREAALRELAERAAILESETRQARDAFLALADTFARERNALLLDVAEEVVALSFEIARKIVRVELEISSAPIVPLVRELLARSAVAERIIVRLSLRDHALLTRELERLPEAAGHPDLRLRADSSLEPGGCVLETEQGHLDARLATQFARLEEVLRRREESTETTSPLLPREERAA